MLCGIGIVVATFLPWYATNLGPPFSPTSASGWEATGLARAAAALGLVAAIAAAAAALDERGAVRLEARMAEAVSWIVVGACGIAAVLVGYRLLWPPEPAEFLSRQIGIYIAMVAALGGVMAGLGLLATRGAGALR
jgi:hypothetical protein